MEIKEILAIVGELTCLNAALRAQVANLEAELEQLKKSKKKD